MSFNANCEFFLASNSYQIRQIIVNSGGDFIYFRNSKNSVKVYEYHFLSIMKSKDTQIYHIQLKLSCTLVYDGNVLNGLEDPHTYSGKVHI